MVYILQYRTPESDIWISVAAYATYDMAVDKLAELQAKNGDRLEYGIFYLDYYSR